MPVQVETAIIYTRSVKMLPSIVVNCRVPLDPGTLVPKKVLVVVPWCLRMPRVGQTAVTLNAIKQKRFVIEEDDEMTDGEYAKRFRGVHILQQDWTFSDAVSGKSTICKTIKLLPAKCQPTQEVYNKVCEN